MSVTEITDDDKASCESIGKSISNIIRFSLDDEFRKSSFKLFGVSSTKDTETEISKRLVSMIETHNAAIVSKKKGRKSSKDKADIQDQSDSSEVKETDESSTISTDCDSQSSSQRSWMQISSEQYMKASKRKKLNFFSQPQFPHERESEFSVCNVNFSNSQPLPQFSSYNWTKNSSSQQSDDGITFCRKRFKESFKDNACKYLKRNSKSQSHKSFT